MYIFRFFKKNIDSFFNAIDTITTKLLILVLCSITIPLMVVANFTSDIIYQSITNDSQSRLGIYKKIFDKKYSDEMKDFEDFIIYKISTYKKINNLTTASASKTFINYLFKEDNNLTFGMVLDSDKKIKFVKGNLDSGLIVNKLSKIINIVSLRESVSIMEEIDGDILNIVITPVFNKYLNSSSVVIVGKSLKNSNIPNYINGITDTKVTIYNQTDIKAQIIATSSNILNINKIFTAGYENYSNSNGFYFDGTNLINSADFYLTIPLVNYFNETIGKVYIGIPKETFMGWVNQNIKSISYIAVISLFVAIIIAALFARKITDPILELADAAESITLGDLNHKVEINGNDETVKLSRSFNKMVSNLERDERLRDNFVATLTHDLKVPMLATNQTITFLLKESYGPVTSEQREVMDLIKSTNLASLEMLGTLLEIYRYDSGNITLFESDFNMFELLTESVNQIKSLAENRKIQVNITSDNDKTYVRADKRDIKRVIHNLTSNAINYGIHRGILNCAIETINDKIIYYPKSDTEYYTTLKKPVEISQSTIISIEDNGIGIAREDMEFLFKRFAQSKGRKPSGSGLGLYYAHQVIELHKGHIWAESSETGGSILKFTLPLMK